MAVSSIGAQSSDWASQLLESFQNRNNSKDDDLADKLMDDLDADGDSALTLEESGLSESVFAAADTDGDGTISAQELADALAQERSQMMAGSATSGAGLLGTLLSQAGVSAPPQGAGQMPPPDEDEMADDLISSLDQDGDSALSLEESGLTEEAFDALDTDGDGVVSSAELAAGLKAEREQMAEGSDSAGGAGGATASNAGADTVLQSLLDKTGLSASGQMDPAQLRKALQAYGNSVLTSALGGQYDADLGATFADYLSSGQMSILNYVGTESVDYTV